MNCNVEIVVCASKGKIVHCLHAACAKLHIARVGMNPESRLVDSGFDSPNLSESCESRVQNSQLSLKPNLRFLDSVGVRVCEMGLGEYARQTMLRKNKLELCINDAFSSGTQCNNVIHATTQYCVCIRWNYAAHVNLVLSIDC